MGTHRPGSGFGRLLRQYRLAAGLTQEELAERSGLSARAIADMERGRTTRPYRRSVRILADALELPGAQRELLDRASRPAAGGHIMPEAEAAAPVPRQLPAAARYFSGRAAEIRALTGLLEQTGRDGGALVISAIAGSAGVGKTGLAVHWAHQIADQFPDGQLYVNLHGYDVDPPVRLADALAAFLRALGVPGTDIPAGTGERAAQYRSLLAGRRMLVMLDNARNADQVRLLLPGTAGCVAVVTSRDSLAGLVARDGARRIELDVLPMQDAVSLLQALVGARVDADPGAAAELAGRCCRLPLALRVAAELATARPDATLAELASDLADQGRLLSRLDGGGDTRTAMRTVFSWSYRHLDPDSARAFRMAGLHPGSGYDLEAAAALIGAAPDRTAALLARLARAHLIQHEWVAGYGIHDLLHAYARELAADHDGEEASRAALTRLFDYYLSTAAAAAEALAATCETRPASGEPVTARTQPVGDAVAARAWLDRHRSTLVAVAAHATDHGWPSQATRLAAVLFRYLEGSGHYPELVALNEQGLRAARLVGDRLAEAEALNNGTVVDLRQGRYQQAAGQLRRALDIYLEIGDDKGQARALGNLGVADFLRGHYQQASSNHAQALELYRRIGDRSGETRTLGNLGLLELRLGRYQQADNHLAAAIELARGIGQRTSEGYSLANRGISELRRCRYDQAAYYLQQALALLRELRDPTGEAYALTNLGLVELRLGHGRQAIEYQRQSLTLARQTGNEPGEAEALNGAGEVFLVLDRPAEARDQHAAALALAAKISDRYEQARAQYGMACSLHVAGDSASACEHWQHALALYADLGTPEAGAIRVHLAAAEAASEISPAPTVCESASDAEAFDAWPGHGAPDQ